MHRFNKYYFWFVYLLLCQIPVYGQKGGQPGAFLRMGMGTESLSMGNAYSVAVSDPNSIYWNPAGLVTVRQLSILGTSMDLPWDRKGKQIAISGPAGAFGSWGAGWIHLGVADIEARDVTGRLNGYFSNMESAYYLSYGFNLHPTVHLGVSLKYLRQTMQDNAANGFGIDFGLKSQIHPALCVGMAIKDLSSQVRWNTDRKTTETFPLSVYAGLFVKKENIPLGLALEYHKVHNQVKSLHAGVQYCLGNVLRLSAGYDDGKPAYGGQIFVNVNQIGLNFGYAVGNDPLSDQTVYRFSVGLSQRIENHLEAQSKQKKQKSILKDRSNNKIQVIKVSSKYSQFGLVNQGVAMGLEEGQELLLYRLIATPDKQSVRQILIGILEVVRVQEHDSAVQVIHMRNGFALQVGDLCKKRK